MKLSRRKFLTWAGAVIVVPKTLTDPFENVPLLSTPEPIEDELLSATMGEQFISITVPRLQNAVAKFVTEDKPIPEYDITFDTVTKNFKQPDQKYMRIKHTCKREDFGLEQSEDGVCWTDIEEIV